MKLRFLFVVLSAAGVSACARSGALVTDEALPAALRSGPHEITLNGARHFYRVGGAAPRGTPPVVFLHGGPGQGSEHFDALAGPHMERRLRMVYFDQRGSGKSERPASGDYASRLRAQRLAALRPDAYARDVAAFVRSP